MSDVYATTRSTIENQERNYGIIQKNIANAQTNGYYKREVDYISDPYTGARIADVKMAVDQSLLNNRNIEQSKLSAISAEDKYLIDILNSLGRPDKINDIADVSAKNSLLNSVLEDFFNQIRNLQLTSNDSVQMISAVKTIDASIKKLKLLADNMLNLRMQADQEIAKTVDQTNARLAQIDLLNKNLILNNVDLNKGSEYSNDMKNEVFNQLAAISEDIDIRTHYSAKGLVITTANGIDLLDGSVDYKLDFKAVQRIEDFKNPDFIFPALSVSGGSGLIDQELVTAAKQGNIVNNLRGGKLHGLFKVRDKIIPELMQQIDEFSNQFALHVNKVYSAAVPDGGYEEMTSAYDFQDTDLINFKRNVDIIFFDDKGNEINGLSLPLDQIKDISSLTAALDNEGINCSKNGNKLILKSKNPGERIAILNNDATIVANGKQQTFNQYFGFAQLFEHTNYDAKPDSKFIASEMRLSESILSKNKIITSKVQKNQNNEYVAEGNNKGIVLDLLKIPNEIIDFTLYEGKYRSNLEDFSQNILLEMKRKEGLAAEGVRSTQIGYEALNKRIEIQGKVDINLQVYQIAELGKIQNANMKVFQVFNQFWEKLFSVI